MNNKLLIAAFATAFSGMALATEASNYDSFPVDTQQYCTQHNTALCQELAAFLVTLEEAKKELINETGVVGLTDEQIQKRHELIEALYLEIGQKDETVSIKNIIETEVAPVVVNLLESETNEEAKELLAQELGNSQQ